ncbi:exodeoxyribonuclease VII small subunit [Corallococcus sp. AB049A]|jgi:exodeoxyribonuclease VII small subunit|uniref:Exodeoxyribonuclease 7 small subunit n=1 Tax=Corallococcus interemptor TaxID=2316720 RepID=A0A3A8PYW4_9BACT|nr:MULTISPECIES: exodeoxyribonuclease VII small subunit [Corallococcus]RKH53405.1 exodeoxyribonuclease VII small subunit [Corallococcus sp. AB050B]RKH61686.1 exodeoxyribonuclease VII small subunit [Corallococcus interemptor]RKI49479.1 exodeoxyribonuclease VII small subunit [Corallococcus sp. AB049A]
MAVAKSDKNPKVEPAPEQYGDVVSRLEETVARLESGDLSLEESLKAFEDGIRLVRRGEKLLTEAEQRIEQLLVDEDGQDVVAPLAVAARPAPQAAPRTAAQARPPPEDDVPF